MRYFKFILLLIAISICFSSCTLFKKRISKPLVVALPDSSFPVLIHSSANYTKYSNYYSKEELAKAFFDAFESEAGLTQNITYTKDTSNADFILKIKSLNISESTFTEKINDANSPYNGQSVELNSIDCSTNVDILDAKNKTILIGNCFNSKIRSEKLKNNRDIGDLITGSNKDKTTYRTKLLSDNICQNLAGDVGRRIWVPITRKLAKISK